MIRPSPSALRPPTQSVIARPGRRIARAIESFNQDFPVGTPVIVKSPGNRYSTRIKSIAFQSSPDQVSVFVDGTAWPVSILKIFHTEANS